MIHVVFLVVPIAGIIRDETGKYHPDEITLKRLHEAKRQKEKVSLIGRQTAIIVVVGRGKLKDPGTELGLTALWCRNTWGRLGDSVRFCRCKNAKISAQAEAIIPLIKETEVGGISIVEKVQFVCNGDLAQIATDTLQGSPFVHDRIQYETTDYSEPLCCNTWRLEMTKFLNRQKQKRNGRDPWPLSLLRGAAL